MQNVEKYQTTQSDKGRIAVILYIYEIQERNREQRPHECQRMKI